MPDIRCTWCNRSRMVLYADLVIHLKTGSPVFAVAPFCDTNLWLDFLILFCKSCQTYPRSDWCPLWNIAQSHPLPHDLIAGDGFFLVQILTNAFPRNSVATFTKIFNMLVVSKIAGQLINRPAPCNNTELCCFMIQRFAYRIKTGSRAIFITREPLSNQMDIRLSCSCCQYRKLTTCLWSGLLYLD